MELDPIDLENQRVELISRFAQRLAIVCVILAALPSLIGWMSAPPGSLYLGIQTNVDDHMVYAAWMRQAMEGRFLFDNRFAVDPQPGLTVHLYFLLLGWIAKLTGIPIAMAVARLALTYLFVIVFGRFLCKLKIEVFAAKYMLLIGCFGGGIGFMVWEKFGQDFVNGPPFLAPLFLGREPIDVWQPEAFVFPSMLTNSLFMVSLCLILGVFGAVLDARESWKPVLKGAVFFGLLMNIHSYDVLLVAFVLLGFLVTQVVQKHLTKTWFLRSLCIMCGAVPAALWFLFVLSKDPVFQARAETLTYSPNFRQILFGILPILILALFGAWRSESKRRLTSFAGVLLLLGGMLALSTNHDPSGYFMNAAGWAVAFALAIGLVGMISTSDDAWNLAWSWAIVGLVSVYFPALFQRKLAIGLVLPWAILAAYGFSALLKPLERSTRNLVATLSLCVMGGSALAWFLRETVYIRNNVASTTMHSVYFSQDTANIIEKLNAETGRRVVLTMPGVWNPTTDPTTGRIIDFKTPLITDLNPILSGLAGVYTYAGHWSETPDYARRRGLSMAVFLATVSPEKRTAILDEVRPDFIVAPNPTAFPEITLGTERQPLADLRSLGETVYEGNQLLLIRVQHH